VTPASPRQQLVHDFGKALDLRDRDTGLFPDDLEIVGHGDLLEAHEQRGQRCSQLM